jgi:NADPH:quinone reductase
MDKIKAVVVDRDAEGHLVIQEVSAPSPAPSEAVVRVAAFSLNLGEVKRANTAENGWRPGWDLAGTVIQSAADGSGPKEGARVVGFLPSGAWAEAVAVPINSLAQIPDNVTFAQASTLPVAGLTALYALEKGGSLIGHKVLITGASGGVGLYACQIANLGGATVVASVRQPKNETLVRENGAHHIVIGEDLAPARQYGRYHIILESVGGNFLPYALSMLSTGGVCVTFGVSAGSGEVTFEVRTLFGTAGILQGFTLFAELGAKPASQGLTRLGNLVAQGRLKPYIEVDTDWKDTARICQDLVNRKIAGKAVLNIN